MVPTPPLSVHFVNNALATAAGLVDEDSDAARDVLAQLGAFLTYRLRGARTVSIADEIDHVGVYLALEQARFPGRVEAELPAPATVPAGTTTPGAVQAPVSEAVARSLQRGRGPVRVAVRVVAAGDAVEARLAAPGARAERVRIALAAPAPEAA
jgi:LytS/YehU family sensor histidine kinase